MMDFNDRKYTSTFAGFAILFLVAGSCLTLGARDHEQQGDNKRRENQWVRNFNEENIPPSTLPFFQTLFPRTDGEDITAMLEEGNLKVESVTEEEEENQSGNFHKFHVSGTGSFSQIMQTFDIIKEKERWSAVNLKELKRAPEGLAYEMEIQTFQLRGTYEKAKHSSHRSHGHRKEPGGEDTC